MGGFPLRVAWAGWGPPVTRDHLGDQWPLRCGQLPERLQQACFLTSANGAPERRWLGLTPAQGPLGAVSDPELQDLPG